MRRLGATITLAILAVAVLAGCGPTASTPNVVGSPTPNVVGLATPNVVGLALDKAHQAFEALGIKEFDDKDAFENRNPMVDSNWAVLGQDPAAGTALDTDTKIKLTIGKIGEDRTTARLPEGSPVLAKIRAEAAAQKAAAAKAVADKAAADKAAAAKAVADKYKGPRYEIVATDENVGVTGLNRYWVYTNKFDYSTAAYKVQVKMIISDIARDKKTANLMVSVVTDKEIVEAESDSTIKGFMDKHGMAYFKNVMVPKEKSDWVASYTGGFDGETGQPSESAAAFEILWRPYATEKIERWKPQIGS